MSEWIYATSFTYNRLGQVTREQRIIQSITYNTDYTYDASGNLSQITYPSGRIVTYARDSLGQITAVNTKENSGANLKTIASSVTHNPFGPLTGLTFGNSIALVVGYNQDNRVRSIYSNGGLPVQDLSYGYDDSGNITSIYDNRQSARSQTFGYDNLSRLNSASGAYGTLSFTYDGAGNRSTRTLMGSGSTNYNYSSTSNRLTGTTVSGSAVRTLSYVNSGQVSQDVRSGTATYGFSYNNDGRLSSASLNSSTVGTYVYNGLQQRVAKTTGSTTTHYIFDRGGRLMSEDNASGNAIREYLWLDDLPVAMIDHTGMSAVIYYIHTDHLGKPQKMTTGGDGSGPLTLAWDAIFQPFGEVYSVTGTATNLLMFPGQFYDSETGLAQNWNRDYDATLGRYIQSDPIGLAGGINTYGYVGGNPVSFVDPSGLGAIGAIIGGDIGGFLGGLGGAIGGTVIEPGGGTVAGGIEGADLGASAGAITGSQIEDQITLMMTARGNVADTQVVQAYNKYASGQRQCGKDPKDRCSWLEENKARFRPDQVKATQKAWGCRRSRS